MLSVDTQPIQIRRILRTPKQIKKELYINKTPEQILQDGVNVKIGRTENNYNEAIKKNCTYILSRH